VDLLMLIECVCCDGRTINEDCGRYVVSPHIGKDGGIRPIIEVLDSMGRTTASANLLTD